MLPTVLPTVRTTMIEEDPMEGYILPTVASSHIWKPGLAPGRPTVQYVACTVLYEGHTHSGGGKISGTVRAKSVDGPALLT
jgi:hypothetical protein